MILGFHLTWTTYGHWFLNDPRGSWSDEIWKPQLREIRDLEKDHRMTISAQVAPPILQNFLNTARNTTKWHTIELSNAEIELTGAAFAEIDTVTGVSIHACAIMRNHVHLVIGRYETTYERTVNRFKGKSSQSVRTHRGLALTEKRGERVPIWTQGYWVRYIDDLDQMECAIEYVNQNPINDGLGKQNWSFIQTFVT